MELYDNIDSISQHMFAYKIKEAGEEMTNMIEHLTSMVEGWPIDRVRSMQGILELALSAMENSDYLLVADVLHFELKPFLRRSLT